MECSFHIVLGWSIQPRHQELGLMDRPPQPWPPTLSGEFSKSSDRSHKFGGTPPNLWDWHEDLHEGRGSRRPLGEDT